MSLSDDEIERYARHLMLAEVGGVGQRRLKAARVAVVGVGGVGGPAALDLAAAGVGALRLIDPDLVSLSNLQRQVQFATADVGRLKVEAAAARLTALNPHVTIEARAEAATPDTAAALLAGCDVVVDGTDDFDVRAAVNAACLALGVPLVSGALGRWSGQVGVFAGRPCWACLVPKAPPEAETCARVGVIGALAGIVGSLCALEAVKLIAGAGAPLTGRLLVYDGLTGAARTARVAADPHCPACGQAKAVLNSAT
ncbi:MAG: molybdopterin-synthase adenylyltransferase MoeB [Alphaproteobacteria bacterium]|nr:molybdopterin-synthase adenylyltransferase MoeB [Alphaproteobacteria bacterium]MBU1526752.1 molybdopterin-synthase adenylyltransferase MoeB [Alphaproteobacteria bacterium]MBU2117914.1 molybdopterin-synthase adenylyltransferase MoeB [Alphaproteobacteria bacterium]MBU2351034.1 molybdopterin-synthase adenylyltransferase MoeB [Alphaproteobacteria bacterium]MBU2382867.1 molybdopterin-synthase adenylyltransferase MoeB [Alphaproteobacteria bacterium]